MYWFLLSNENFISTTSTVKLLFEERNQKRRVKDSVSSGCAWHRFVIGSVIAISFVRLLSWELYTWYIFPFQLIPIILRISQFDWVSCTKMSEITQIILLGLRQMLLSPLLDNRYEKETYSTLQIKMPFKWGITSFASKKFLKCKGLWSISRFLHFIKKTRGIGGYYHGKWESHEVRHAISACIQAAIASRSSSSRQLALVLPAERQNVSYSWMVFNST